MRDQESGRSATEAASDRESLVQCESQTIEDSARAEDNDIEIIEDPEPEKHIKGKKGVLLGLIGGFLVLAIVVGLAAAFFWPGFGGPSSPDAKISEATAALASKDPGQLEQVSCHGPDGKSTAQIPPQAMQLIQSAKSAGPAQLVLDTEAHAPVDLTLSAKGQTQTLPSVAVLGVTDRQWCLKGIAQR